MRVVAYLRVSTDAQAERGLGLDVQRQAIQKWAKQAGHRVVGWYADEGVSGSNGLDSRIGLLDAMEAIRGGKASGLVVYRLDRLARDLIIQEQILAELRRMGTEVFSTSAAEASYLGDDPDDPSRKLIRQVLGAVAEYERSIIALRMRAGRRRKAEQGGYAYGSPPYGMRSESGQLVPEPTEAETLSRIRRLRGEGKSLREIAAMLNADGLRTKRGKSWHASSVSRALDQATPGRREEREAARPPWRDLTR